jgi:hypothetical protein
MRNFKRVPERTTDHGQATGKFYHFRLRVESTLFVIVYCWARDMPQNDFKHEADIGDNDVTVVDWSNFCRGVCAQWLQNREIGGFDAAGQPFVVEIDETKFVHHKYHRG